MEISILEEGSVPRTNRKSSIVRWKCSGRSMDREGRYQLPRYFIKNNGPVKNCFEAKSRPISALPFAGQFRDESRLLEKEGENHFFPFFHIENSSCLDACVSRLFHEKERDWLQPAFTSCSSSYFEFH